MKKAFPECASQIVNDSKIVTALHALSFLYAVTLSVDPTGRFAAVEFHYFMHMRAKTICGF